MTPPSIDAGNLARTVSTAAVFVIVLPCHVETSVPAGALEAT